MCVCLCVTEVSVVCVCVFCVCMLCVYFVTCLGPQVFALGHVLQADELASLIDFKIVQHTHTRIQAQTLTSTPLTHTFSHTLTLAHTHNTCSAAFNLSGHKTTWSLAE